MTSKTSDQEAFVWMWLKEATHPVVAGKLEADDRGRIQFNYGRSYLERVHGNPPASCSISSAGIPMTMPATMPPSGMARHSP